MQNADQSQRVFRRIIWAPKILDAGEPSAGPAVERDPLQALERCDKQIGADKIDGDILEQVRRIPLPISRRNGASAGRDEPAGNKLEVYLAYHGADEDYAEAVAEALRGGPVKIRIPACEADADARRYNNDLLVKSDAVTLCWANASEVWVRSEADKLSDWQTLGRKQPFVYRSLIAGPPPFAHKKSESDRPLVPGRRIRQGYRSR